MKKKPILTREEFEANATQKLQEAVDNAKQSRELLRQLEKDITDKQAKINKYQDKFSNLEKQLVEMLAIIYAKGT